MRFHPSVNKFIVSLAYILELVEVVPQLDNETGAYGLFECEGGTWWQVVICSHIFMFERGYKYLRVGGSRACRYCRGLGL